MKIKISWLTSKNSAIGEIVDDVNPIHRNIGGTFDDVPPIVKLLEATCSTCLQ